MNQSKYCVPRIFKLLTVFSRVSGMHTKSQMASSLLNMELKNAYSMPIMFIKRGQKHNVLQLGKLDFFKKKISKKFLLTRTNIIKKARSF